MAQRTYNQFCPVAKSLDMLGERWTLLVVRSLIPGPLRFTDLLAELPGVGKNQLSSRLRQLESKGIVQRRRLPPPGAATVYELTEFGRGLEVVILGLARLGLQWLNEYVPGQAFLPSSFMVGLLATFRPEVAGDLREVYELRIGEHVYNASVGHGEARVQRGPASNPALVITSDEDMWMAVGSGSVSPMDALQSGRIRVEGDMTAMQRFMQVFGTPALRQQRQ